MRTWERLWKLKAWFEQELCEGHEFKCPTPNKNRNYAPEINDFTMAKPRVFLAWQPMKPDEPGKLLGNDPYSVCPSITIMPCASYIRYTKDQRYDHYDGLKRSQDMGQSLSVQVLFSIYEPGVRWPGFADSLEAGKADMSLLKDGTEAGLKTLVNWMDDAMELILRERTVPGTDLILDDDNAMYSLYTDQQYVSDRRPLYYGFLTIEFKGFANKGNDKGKPTKADRLLDGYD